MSVTAARFCVSPDDSRAAVRGGSVEVASTSGPVTIHSSSNVSLDAVSGAVAIAAHSGLSCGTGAGAIEFWVGEGDGGGAGSPSLRVSPGGGDGGGGTVWVHPSATLVASSVRAEDIYSPASLTLWAAGGGMSACNRDGTDMGTDATHAFAVRGAVVAEISGAGLLVDGAVSTTAGQVRVASGAGSAAAADGAGIRVDVPGEERSMLWRSGGGGEAHWEVRGGGLRVTRAEAGTGDEASFGFRVNGAMELEIYRRLRSGATGEERTARVAVFGRDAGFT